MNKISDEELNEFFDLLFLDQFFVDVMNIFKKGYVCFFTLINGHMEQEYILEQFNKMKAEGKLDDILIKGC